MVVQIVLFFQTALLQRAQTLSRQMPDLKQVDSFAPYLDLVQSSLLIAI